MAKTAGVDLVDANCTRVAKAGEMRINSLPQRPAVGSNLFGQVFSGCRRTSHRFRLSIDVTRLLYLTACIVAGASSLVPSAPLHNPLLLVRRLSSPAETLVPNIARLLLLRAV